MKKIVRGNDVVLRIPVTKVVNGESYGFPLGACEAVSVSLVNSYKRYALAWVLEDGSDNVLLATMEGDAMPCGAYALEVKGKAFGSNWRSNEYAQVQIVNNNAAADTELGGLDEGESSVEMDTAVVVMGASVPALTPRGAWDANTTYKRGDTVSHGVGCWWAYGESTGSEPKEGSGDWVVLVDASVAVAGATEATVRADAAAAKAETAAEAAEKGVSDLSEVTERSEAATAAATKAADGATLAAEAADAANAAVSDLSEASEKSEKATAAANAAATKAETAAAGANTAAAAANAAASDLSDLSEKSEAATASANTAAAGANKAADAANAATASANTATASANSAASSANTAATNANNAVTKANTAATNANNAATNANNAATKATTVAGNVNATLSDVNVLTITDAQGVSKSLDLADAASVGDVVASAARASLALGHYSDRDDIVLTATETNKAISSDGVKVTKSGWAIAEFTAEKGNEYLFKPGVTDGSVCLFAEYIDKVEDRAIDYTYTYNTDGTIATATATYGGKTYTYTYTWATDAGGNTVATIKDASGNVVSSLPLLYTTTVGTYSPLVKLNADAELPTDGYCRFMSHFQGNSALKVVVSYKVGSADLTMKVLRDGVFASISTQLGNLSQKQSQTESEIAAMGQSYVDVYSIADGTISVDGKNVSIAAKTRTRLYPKASFIPMALGANLKIVGAKHLDTSGFTELYQHYGKGMFQNCKSLATLDVSGWDVGNVTTMWSTFYGCSSLTSLDVSGWDTSKVTNFWWTFYGCSKLTTLDMTGWDMSSATDTSYTFGRCGALTTLIGSHTLEEVEAGTVTTMNGLKIGISLSASPKLDRKSLLAVIKGLADLTGATSQTLTLGSTLKAKLTSDDIAIATGKNWAIA